MDLERVERGDERRHRIASSAPRIRRSSSSRRAAICAGLYRRQYGAAWLGAMAAVAEPAPAGERCELRESALDLRAREVCESERFNPGRVDDDRAVVEPVEPGRAGRVAAGIEEARDLARGGADAGNERVDDRRLAHPGLTDEHRGLVGKQRAQRGDVESGAELHDRMAGARKRCQPFAQDARRRFEIGLVEDDERAHRLAVRLDQDPGHELVARARLARDDHRHLGGVGGDELPPVGCGAEEQRGARIGRFDHALAGAGAGDEHAVAAGVRRLPPARHARDALAVRGFDQEPAAVRGRDLARQRARKRTGAEPARSFNARGPAGGRSAARPAGASRRRPNAPDRA